MVDKQEVRLIKVFGRGRLYNPDTGEYFARFDENGETLVNPEEAKVIKQYHKQVRFVGQKEKPVKTNIKDVTTPKSFSEIKTGFKLPKK